MKIQLFIPCYIDQLYPQTGFNTIKLLEKVGCEAFAEYVYKMMVYQ